GDGLALRTSNSIIRGLVINRFAGAGISVSEVNNQIEGNFIGTDPTGTLDRGNGSDGIFVANYTQPIGASNNTIGGSNPAARNLISANGNGAPGSPRNGITLDQVVNTFIYGNYIGTNASGTAALGNYQTGIGIYRGATTVVGGSEPGQGNLISGNRVDGIGASDINQSGGHTIQGNLIGTDAQGNPTLGNQRHGISLVTRNYIIGGANPGEGNVIAGNGQSGITIGYGVGNAIRGNAIFANGGQGIDLGGNGVDVNDVGDSDGGANNGQNYPVIFSAISGDGGGVTVQAGMGGPAGTAYIVQFFTSPSCDATGFGEGQSFLSDVLMTTNAEGVALLNTNFESPPLEGNFLTATATENQPNGNSSEFSLCMPIQSDNTTWPNALDLTFSGPPEAQTANASQFLTRRGEVRWYKLTVQASNTIMV
ncbi:MAG: hypothetical protein KDE31_22975, partial [Caldilineaceae bacterium]|nr:hypothetical protein [Caldilineaceae bacterium]